MTTVRSRIQPAASPTWLGQQDPPCRRDGQVVLTVGYVALLAGQFNVPALAGLPSFEVRLPLLVVSGAIWLIWILGTRRREPLARGVFGYAAALTVLALYLVLSTVWAPPYSASGQGIEDIAYTAGFLVIACTPLARNIELGDYLWRLLMWTGVVYTLVALLQGPGDQGRYAAFGGGPNIFVRVVLLGAIAAVVLALRHNRPMYLWTVPLTLSGVILSGSRGGLIALAAAGAVLAVFALVKNTQLALRGVLLMAAAGGAILVVVGDQVAAVFQKRIVTDTLVDGYSSMRTSLFEGAWQQFLTAPIAGHGLGGYWALVGRFIGFEYPHNVVLLAATEGGIIGAALLLALLVWPLVAGIPRSAAHVGSLSAFIAIVTSAMFSGGIYDARFIWFFGLLVFTYRDAYSETEVARDSQSAGGFIAVGDVRGSEPRAQLKSSIRSGRLAARQVRYPNAKILSPRHVHDNRASTLSRGN